MSAITLISTPEPSENVCLEQAQVKIIWEGQNFGFGTLYITERYIVWISDQSENGFTLTYPSIGVYGVSAADHQHPDPSLFMVVDLNKTNIPLAQQPAATNDSDEDDGLAEDGSRTATLRLIPDDSNSLNLITGLMQQCNLLHPDVEEEVADPDYSFAEHITDQSERVEADDSWFTGETPDNEIQLSAEGRSNLERIVGDLDIDPPHQNQDPNNHHHNLGDHPNNGDQMDM